MKHPCKAAYANTDEQPSVFCEFGRAKKWLLHPNGSDY